MEYLTVQKEGRDEFVEKKSRFIGTCRPVKSEKEALAFISAVKSEFWDARHNVFAYVLRENGTERFSDDGEPQGTAGIPVIESIKKAGLTDIAVVVTRYFGGILLGGGGLIRAYSHAASIAAQAAGKVIMRECLLLSLRCDYSSYGRVSTVIPECGGAVDSAEFTENVAISFHAGEKETELISRKISDITGGKAVIKQEGKNFFEFSPENTEIKK